MEKNLHRHFRLMDEKIFDPEFQNQHVASKIVVGLERISEAFRKLLWEHAKTMGVSPIQIQILVFVAYHKASFSKVSYLAKEFGVTKPTISDAVRVLVLKKLAEKVFDQTDNRSYSIRLTKEGKKLVERTELFSNPILHEIKKIEPDDLDRVFDTVRTLVFQLSEIGVIGVQRTCQACQFFETKKDKPFCSVLDHHLRRADFRLDCPEFESKDSL